MMKTLGVAMLAAVAIVAPPAGAQAVTAGAEDNLPPGRPIPKPPVSRESLGKPAMRSGPAADYPEAARMAGEHGKVVISGIVTVEGKLEAPSVLTSSRSAQLDAAALKAASASSFFPGKDENGVAIAASVQIPFEFYAQKSDQPGGGLQYYGCRAFVRDTDWWKATWPELGYQGDQLHTMALGLGIMARVRSPGFQAAAIRQYREDFEKRWLKAIDACRAKPDALFVDMIKPEGDYAKAMSQAIRDGLPGKRP